MGRDRAGYPQPYTRNDLHREGRYADAREARFLGFTLDGRPFGHEPVRHRGPSRYDPRVHFKDAEFEIVARTLAKAGYTDLAFASGERPDWTIRFPNGAIVGAEASEIDLTADFTNQLIDLRIALLEAVDAEPTLPIGERTIWFSFGPLAFRNGFTKDALPGNARRVLVRALVDYLRAGTFATGRIIGHPVLESYGMQAYISDGGPAVDISDPACSFAPLGPFNAAITRVRLKIARAAKYDQRHPLWLFLYITDTMGVFTPTVERFATVGGPIAPFEAVFLSDGRTMSVIRAPAVA